MTRIDYASMAGIRWSQLKHMQDSPLAYRYHLDVPVEDKPAFQVGRLTHTLVFEPELFQAEYAIWTGERRAGKEWEAFKAANAERTIFKADEIEVAVNMANAVKSHPLVQPYLVGGQFEVPIQWTDPVSGLACKAKPDWIIPERRILVDLKTCRNADAYYFGTDAGRYGYHRQLAHYANGITHALGWEPEEVLLIAVEKDAPHDLSVYVVDPDALYMGAEDVSALLAKVKACQATDEWPGRYQSRQPLMLPKWMYRDDTEELGLIVEEE